LRYTGGMAKIGVQTTIRVEADVYEGGQEAARRAGLSLNAWIVRAMREQAEREGAADGVTSRPASAATAPRP
jgi:hypothetical protein